jgi:hypothetical protein
LLLLFILIYVTHLSPLMFSALYKARFEIGRKELGVERLERVGLKCVGEIPVGDISVSCY